MKHPRFISILVAIIMVGILFFAVISGQKAIFKDQSYEFHYQGAKYLFDQLNKGDFPLWNQRAAMGEPFAAYPEYSIFYPLMIPLLLVLPPIATINFLILLQYLLMVGFTSAFARKLGQSAVASIITGVGFAFSGYLLLLHTEFQSLGALVALPMALYFFEIYRREKRKAFIIMAALSLGIGHLAGGIQYSLYVDMLFVIWTLFVSKPAEPGKMDRLKNAGVVALIMVLSIAMAAITLLPASEMSKRSLRSQVGYDQAANSPKSPDYRGFEIGAADLFGFVYPVEPGKSTADSKPVHFGLLIIILAIFGAAAGQGRIRFWLLGIILFSFLIAAGRHTPLFEFYYSLPIPGVGMFKNPVRMIVITSFALSILAGFGADALFQKKSHFVYGFIGLLLFTGAIIGALIFFNGGYYPCTLIIAFSICIFVAGLLLLDKKADYAKGLLLMGVCLNMLACYPALDLLPMSEVEKRINPTPITDKVHKTGPGRLFADNPKPGFAFYNNLDLVENTGMGRKISLADGNSSLHSARYLWFTAGGDDVDPIRQYAFPDFYRYPPLAAMANLVYLVLPHDAPVDEKLQAGQIETFEENVLYKIADNRPARMSQKWVCVKGEKAAKNMLKQVREQMPLTDIIESCDGDNEPAGFAKESFIYSRPYADLINIKAENNEPGFLIISEGYAPGWKAYLNDKPTKISPANLAFMAVWLPPGTNQVTLEYKPPGFYAGLLISLISMLFSVSYLVIIQAYKTR